jgi:hypothetical protein
MSKRNGDKARFNRKRKKKLLNRNRNRELWKALECGAAGATGAQSRNSGDDIAQVGAVSANGAAAIGGIITEAMEKVGTERME